MKIIVTGGRDYKDYLKVGVILDELEPQWVAVGDCRSGVDKFVRDWFIDMDRINYEVYYADWETHGKAAGPLRNIAMIEENTDCVVIAFPGGKGTENCVREAKKRGLVVLRVE